MALSYIGVNQTPKSLLNATEGKTALMWTTYGSAKCSSLGTSAASISAAMDNYINGNGKYSPLVIQMTPYPSSGNQHFVILAGKVSENEYFVVDPARPNGWTMTVSGSSASLSWTSGSYPITSVHQWYNPNASCDTTPPVISNVQIIDKDETGYTISCTVTDDIGVNRVQFPTWTENNGQDDLFADWTNNPAASGTQNGNVYTYRVKIADHNNETLNYITDIYAYDNYGNVAVSRDPVLQFVHIDVTATFNANGGSCSTSTKTVSPGSAIGTLPTPIRDGYEFAGWYPDLYAGSTPITSSTTVSSNVIYYAHWTSERNQDYHIVFNPNGGELPDVYKMMDVDGHNTGRGGAMLTVYDCDGMTYKHNGIGFVVAVNSNGRVVDKRIYGNSSDITVPNGGFLLSAQSQSPACKILEALPDVVYVAYDESSGRVYLYDSENAYISYHKYMSPYDSYEKLPVPTREGYVFDGWFPEMGNEIEWDTSYQPGEVRASWVPSESARPSGMSSGSLA